MTNQSSTSHSGTEQLADEKVVGEWSADDRSGGTAGDGSVAPAGYHTVTPWLISPDTAQLIDFVVAAFGAEEIARIPNADGGIGHAEVRIGDSVVMMFDSRPEWGPTPGFLRLYVPDCDAVHGQAIAAGATSVTEATTMFFGERVARVRDPLGNVWWLHTRLEELDPEEMGRRAALPKYVEAMQYVQSAEIVKPMAG